MAIYNYDGSILNAAYDYAGLVISSAYDKGGGLVFPDEGVRLKVMSYNVGSWTAFGGKATAENQETWHTLQNAIFQTERPDLAGIQEYYSAIGSYSVPVMLRQYLPYIYAVDWVSTKAGRAIASKTTMTNATEINFVNQTGEQRSYLIGDIDIAGKTVKFITAHLALDTATIKLQIQELVSAVASFDYWILTGDFNIPFPDAQSEGYEALIEPFLDRGYNVANGSTFGFIPTFSTKKPGDDSDWRCIDNIMCSSNIQITDVYTNKQKLTEHQGYSIDHLPLIADMLLT